MATHSPERRVQPRWRRGLRKRAFLASWVQAVAMDKWTPRERRIVSACWTVTPKRLYSSEPRLRSTQLKRTYNDPIIPNIVDVTVISMFVSLVFLLVHLAKLSGRGIILLPSMTPANVHRKPQTTACVATAKTVIHVREEVVRRSRGVWNVSNRGVW